jgi:3-dehydroquinate dehydratase-2
MKIPVLQGLHLNMFDKRDPAQYGTITLEEINQLNSVLIPVGSS